MVFKLDDNEIIFPDPSLADEDGLLAVGGDYKAERLLLAYNNGISPWFSGDGYIYWYSPHERCVIAPAEIIISKRMRKILNNNVFKITSNTAFESVMENCKTIQRANQDGTWISDEMKNAYTKLHHLGHAASVEVWQKEELIGGLYGLKINNTFCGESMFSKEDNASKAALIWLCLNGGYNLIDCQIRTNHLISMGAKMISQKENLQILKEN
jgi:leucyl/phenylalanyl-tRNA--protein transferase